jgi:predicted SAM-dependent methyltransferase
MDKLQKLHIGCGRVRFDGWVNLDAEALEGVVDVECDVTQGLPFADNSCALVYHEHFLEHLPVAQGVQLLAECRRVLQPNGVMRVAMPSLEELLEKCYLGTWPEDCVDLPHIQTRAELLNIAFRDWGHQWLYDRVELRRRLQEAGFSEIRDCGWHQSEIPELAQIETRPNSTLICEAVKSDRTLLPSEPDPIPSRLPQIQQLEAENQLLRQQLAAMETSKFWQLRSQWFKLKQTFQPLR